MRTLFGLVVLFSGVHLMGQDIHVTGDWDLVIDQSKLIIGSDIDLPSDYTSDPDQVQVDVEHIADRWQVSCYGIFTNWHRDLRLSVRRTSEGTGSGWVKQGENFKRITESDRQIFRGLGERWGISMQYFLEGISIEIPPDHYTATLVYTVTPQ